MSQSAKEEFKPIRDYVSQRIGGCHNLPKRNLNHFPIYQQVFIPLRHNLPKRNLNEFNEWFYVEFEGSQSAKEEFKLYNISN